MVKGPVAPLTWAGVAPSAERSAEVDDMPEAVPPSKVKIYQPTAMNWQELRLNHVEPTSMGPFDHLFV